MCVFTFSLGGHFERCRALALAVAVMGYNPEAIFGVWHEVLDGDLHLPWTAGIHNSLPDVDTHTKLTEYFMSLMSSFDKKKSAEFRFVIY